MEEQIRKALSEGAAACGVSLDSEQINKFEKYSELLIETNKVMNLTAITEPMEIVNKHFIDSLSVLTYKTIPQNASMVDIGSGAGFPGIPIKIVRPDIRLCCIDSLGKRITFLEKLANELSIENCEFVHGRAEEEGRKEIRREKYDVAAARAVAGLRELAELCLPFVKVGGVFLAMKGPGGQEEADEAKKAAEALGAEITKVCKFTLQNAELSHTIVVFEKISRTPTKYPRPFAKIHKNPI